MTPSIRARFLHAAIALLIAPVGAVALAQNSLPAAAEAQTPAPGTISVVGSGTSHVAPDIATIKLTVVREAQSARVALDTNSAAMQAVLISMVAAGISDRDLQTSDISIQPRMVYPKRNSGEAPNIVGYVVRNSLNIKIRKLHTLGQILDQAVTLGVNSGGHIRFGNDNPSAVITQARKRAVGDAISKANVLAQAAGTQLGRIIKISEHQTAPQPRPMSEMRMMAADSAPRGSVPITGGENSYTVKVNVTWELAD